MEVLPTKYLFFDLEDATSKGGIMKICEFGYVLTNEQFEVLERGNFIIDPNINRSDWDWRVVRTILTRKVKEYEKSPRFDEYYDDICDLISNADYVFGHSLDGDAQALNQECKRYDLASIDFVFYDIKLFYREYANAKRDVSVVEILEKLGIKGEENTHDAETDAYNTMLALKSMLEALDMSSEAMIELCTSAKNTNKNYEVESIVKNQKIREEKFKEHLSSEGDNTIRRGRPNGILFLQFLDNVLPTDNISKRLSNLKFSISINYEEKHYKQMLNIVQILCNLGATYVMKATTADYFVTYDVLNEDGTIRECSKLKHVNQANEAGANIKVISFDEFMDLLEITENELDNLPMVSFNCLYREDAKIKDRKTLRLLRPQTIKQQDTNSIATIGDMCGEFFKDYLTNN